MCNRPSEAMTRRRDPIYDSVGKFCTDNWTVRKRYQLIVQNKLLSTIQAYPLGFLTGDPMPWKRFCLFCLFHASLSIVDCSVQLVYTKFPNRVIYRGQRRCIGLGGCSDSRINSLIKCIIGHRWVFRYPEHFVNLHYRSDIVLVAHLPLRLFITLEMWICQQEEEMIT